MTTFFCVLPSLLSTAEKKAKRKDHAEKNIIVEYYNKKKNHVSAVFSGTKPREKYDGTHENMYMSRGKYQRRRLRKIYIFSILAEVKCQ